MNKYELTGWLYPVAIEGKEAKGFVFTSNTELDPITQHTSTRCTLQPTLISSQFVGTEEHTFNKVHLVSLSLEEAFWSLVKTITGVDVVLMHEELWRSRVRIEELEITNNGNKR